MQQEIIIGLFLFDIHLNDIINIDKIAKLVIYADDIALLFSSKYPSEIITNANKTLLDMENKLHVMR